MTICNMSLWKLLDESQRAFIWYEASLPPVRCPGQKAVYNTLKKHVTPKVQIPGRGPVSLEWVKNHIEEGPSGIDPYELIEHPERIEQAQVYGY